MHAAQAGRGPVVAWSLGRDAPSGRSFPPEPALCVACTPCGALVAAGGASGAVWLWEGATGRLLRAWGAHYRPAGAIAFAPDGSWLLTGGGDGVASAWDIAAVADAGAATPPSPRHAWPAHTLPVTAVVAAAGSTGPLAVTASLDASVRVFCAASGAALLSVALPSPARCLALDAGEHAAYAGCDDGVVYEVDLVGGGEGGGDRGVRGGDAPLPRGVAAALRGHAGPVTCALAPPSSPPLVVTGSADGSVRVWCARTRAPLRELTPAGGPAGGVVALAAPPPGVLPCGLIAGSGGGGGASAAPMKPPQLARDRSEPWLTPPIALAGSTPFAGGVAATGVLGEGEADDWGAGAGAGGAASASAAPADADLSAQLAAALADAAKWRAEHARVVAAAAAGLAG